MQKKYLAWKDPNCNGVNPEWVELTAPDFSGMLQHPENKNRWFIIVDFADPSDDVYIMEATKQEYAAWKKEYNAKRYRWMRDKGIKLVSLDALTEDASDVVNALSADAVDVEDVAITRALCKRIPAALKALSSAEKDLMKMLYVDKLSGREAAKILHVSESTLRYRRDAALHKLFRKL